MLDRTRPQAQQDAGRPQTTATRKLTELAARWHYVCITSAEVHHVRRVSILGAGGEQL